MSVEHTIALRAFVAILAATAGGIIGLSKKRVSHKLLCGMVSLAAGALLGVTVGHIMPETMHMLGAFPAIGTVLAGTAIFAGIGKYVYFLCPACAASVTEKDSGYLRLGILLMVAMGIHSTVDGLAISVGSAAGSSIGMMILLAVSYHKVPEGLALVSVARLAGYTRAKALGITFLIQLTTAFGAVLGMMYLRDVSHFWLGIVFGLVAGSFLYTVGFALIKEMYAHEKNSILIYVAIGFLSMIALGMMISGGCIHHAH